MDLHNHCKVKQDSADNTEARNHIDKNSQHNQTFIAVELYDNVIGFVIGAAFVLDFIYSYSCER
jgi:hypothetical protein